MSIAYYNGQFCAYSDIKIPLSDRSVFFGDGIYDAAIGKCGKIYLENEHLDRFIANAKRLNIPLAQNKATLSGLIHEAINRNPFEQYFVYLQLSRFSEERTHSFKDSDKSNLLITVKEHTLPEQDKKLKLTIADDIRYKMCDIKTLNLLPAVMASKRAECSGYDETVFIRDGMVTECAHSNVSMIKDGVLYTHPTNNFILPGITRARMLYMCKRLGIPYKEIPFSHSELINADSILVTSTTKLALIADSVDGIKVGNGYNAQSKLLISALRNDFLESQNEEC